MWVAKWKVAKCRKWQIVSGKKQWWQNEEWRNVADSFWANWGQGYLIDSLTVTDSLRRDFESISINHEIQLEKENN